MKRYAEGGKGENLDRVASCFRYDFICGGPKHTHGLLKGGRLRGGGVSGEKETASVRLSSSDWLLMLGWH